MYKSLFFIGCLSLISLPISSYANMQEGSQQHETATQYIKGSTITANIKTQLLADPDVKSLHISVKTVKGVVTLRGYVENAMQKEKAVSIAKNVDGVKTVKDELKVRPAR